MGKAKWAIMSLTDDDMGPPNEVLLEAALNSFTDEELESELDRRYAMQWKELFEDSMQHLDKLIEEWEK